MLAHQRRDNRPACLEFLNSIKGILFMGTPHRGSGTASLGAICADMLWAASLGINTNPALVKELKQGSRTLEDISRAFVDLGAGFPIHSFIEMERIEYFNRVVSRMSVYPQMEFPT